MEDNTTVVFRRQISHFIHAQKAYLGKVRDIANELNSGIFLFGGASRGAYKKASYKPRDFDLVIEDDVFDAVISKLSFRDYKLNRFGGVKATYQGMNYDLWPLSKTWAFMEGHVKNEGMKSLPKTTFFNADAIVVALGSKGNDGARTYYEEGFYDCFTKRILDINLEPNPFPQLCLIRAIKLSLQYDLKWSYSLLKYAYSILENTDNRDLIKQERYHYGTMSLSSKAFDSLRRSVEDCLFKSKRDSYAIFQGELDLFSLGGVCSRKSGQYGFETHYLK